MKKPEQKRVLAIVVFIMKGHSAFNEVLPVIRQEIAVEVTGYLERMGEAWWKTCNEADITEITEHMLLMVLRRYLMDIIDGSERAREVYAEPLLNDSRNPV